MATTSGSADKMLVEGPFHKGTTFVLMGILTVFDGALRGLISAFGLWRQTCHAGRSGDREGGRSAQRFVRKEED